MPGNRTQRRHPQSRSTRVYAGTDVLTGKPNYVGEVIKPGPHAAELAEEAKQRLVDEVQADRHVKTNASLVQLIEVTSDELIVMSAENAQQRKTGSTSPAPAPAEPSVRPKRVRLRPAP